MLKQVGSETRRRVPVSKVALVLVCFFAAVMASGCASEDEANGPRAFADKLTEALTTGGMAYIPKTPDTLTLDAVTQSEGALDPLLEATGVAAAPVQLVEVSPATDRNNVGSRAVATLAWDWDFGEGNTWQYRTTADLEVVADTGGGSAGWAVNWAPSILAPELAGGERVLVSRVVPERAYILDSQGEPLVIRRPVWTIGIDKTFIEPELWDEASRQLVDRIAEVGYQFDADAYSERVKNAGERAFVELITLRQENSPITRSEVEQIAGARALDGTKDLAPTSTFARAILGSVGEATAELIENSDGRLVAGDITGLSGLQRYYDEQLVGEPGLLVEAYNPANTDRRTLYEIAAVEPINLETTFDTAAQIKAEEILANFDAAVNYASDSRPGAAIVAIRVSTGEVIVAANGPGAQGNNIALLGQYPPGSTFKVVDALALHRHGVGADSVVPCTDTIEVDGRVFQNVPGYPAGAVGDVPFRTAFANSCNTAFISQRNVVSAADLNAAAADLGLGVPSPLGLGAYFGSVPDDATGTQLAADLLGQGTVQASPFGMARVAASIAAGRRIDPVLVRSGNTSQVEVPASSLTEAEATFVRDLMGSVVAEGSATMLQDIPGIVGAKTGTAQFGDGSQNHTWMIAIMGDYAVAVFVEIGEFGATTSGPIMHEFLQYLATR